MQHVQAMMCAARKRCAARGSRPGPQARAAFSGAAPGSAAAAAVSRSRRHGIPVVSVEEKK